MSITHRITRTCNDGSATPLTGTEVVTSGAANNLDEAIPSNQTDLVVAFSFTKAKLKSFFILSDVAMTVKTIHGGSTQETITLTAGQPIQWTLLDAALMANPFADDVASLKVTNTTAGTLQIRTVIDPT